MSLTFSVRDDPVCPYCHAELEYEPSVHAETGDPYCDYCDRPFRLQVEWHPAFESFKLWSTNESPYGYIAYGEWTTWKPSHWAWQNWLDQARSEWVGVGEDGRCDTQSGWSWRFQAYVFPWEDES